MKNCPTLAEDDGSHIREHSLEVQLPFLQFIHLYSKHEFKIVPIILSSPFHCLEIADGLKKTISQSDENIMIIASSDFTHFGPNYEYAPFVDDPDREVREFDLEAIDMILKGDYEKFLEFVEDNNATICGYLPISVMLRALGFIDPKDPSSEHKARSKLLKYYRSSDIAGDNINSVGYASIVFYG
jgi:hypothetical protein